MRPGQVGELQPGRLRGCCSPCCTWHWGKLQHDGAGAGAMSHDWPQRVMDGGNMCSRAPIQSGSRSAAYAGAPMQQRLFSSVFRV